MSSISFTWSILEYFESGWKCEESGWEYRESGWECGESGWVCRCINTWQVFYKEFARQDIPRYIIKFQEKLISRNTSQQLLPRIAIASFLPTFNKVSLKFHLPEINNISKKIFLRPLINSYFCFNLITLQNFVLRTKLTCGLFQLNPGAWGGHLNSLFWRVLLVTCVLFCLSGEWVSFRVSAAIEADGAWVWAKSGLRFLLLPKVCAILGNGNRVWE